MALDLTQIQAATNDWFKKNQVSDIHFEDNVLLYLLFGQREGSRRIVSGSDVVDGGKKVRFFLEYNESNGGTYGATTEIDYSKKDILNAARFGWAGYYAAQSVDLDEIVQNDGVAAMVKIIMVKLNNIQKTVRKKMAAGVFGTNTSDSKAFSGLQDLFNTTTSTAYGSIAEDDMASWKANVIDTAKTISYGIVQSIVAEAQFGNSRESKPNLGITTLTLKDGYSRSLQVQQRFVNTKLLDAGFSNIMHDHMSIVDDNQQATGYFDALNTRHLYIKAHRSRNFTRPVWVADPDNPDLLKANQRWVGVMATDNRKAHCRHKQLSAPAL